MSDGASDVFRVSCDGDTLSVSRIHNGEILWTETAPNTIAGARSILEPLGYTVEKVEPAPNRKERRAARKKGGGR